MSEPAAGTAADREEALQDLFREIDQLVAQHQFKSAARRVVHAERAEPAHGVAWGELARAALRVQRPEVALAALERLPSVWRQGAMARLRIDVLRRLGRHEAADADLAALRLIEPGDRQLADQWAARRRLRDQVAGARPLDNTLLVEKLVAQGQLPEAAAMLRRIHWHQPADPVVARMLAVVEAALDDHEESAR